MMPSVKTHALNYLERYWGILVLLAWAGALLALGVLRLDRYGIDEGAARALILNWSIFDRVLNPLITLGVPDFRALLFLPLGAYWSGSLVAAKVYTMIIAFIAVTILYRWTRRNTDSETALIGCGLLLIFPLFINQIDAVGPGIYLLLSFTVGAWILYRHDNAPRPMSAWYFILMIWVLITITIHPVGLALPLALLWHWSRKQEAEDRRRRKYVYAGLTLVVVITLAMRGGWQTVEWLGNPFLVLGQSWHGLTGITGEPGMFVASVLTLALLIVAWVDRRFLLDDVLGSMLVFGIVIGLLAADPAWALIAVTLVLLRGTRLLIQLNGMFGAGGGFMRNRGLVLAVFFIVSTSAMISDKIRIQAIEAGEVDMQDQLIRLIAMEVDAEPELAEDLAIASQWPGRTMIATRINTFQLPPDREQSNEEFLESIRGITHMLFDPQDQRNALLVRRVAELSGATQTLDVNAAGALLRVTAWDIEGTPPAADDGPEQAN